jgi:hypothetical protein
MVSRVAPIDERGFYKTVRAMAFKNGNFCGRKIEPPSVDLTGGGRLARSYRNHRTD